MTLILSQNWLRERHLQVTLGLSTATWVRDLDTGQSGQTTDNVTICSIQSVAGMLVL